MYTSSILQKEVTMLNTLTVKDLVYIALLTAMLAVASIVAIPVGLPTPVTLQVFFWLLIPALLGAYKGFLSLALYLIMGLIGLPVFAGGSGGIHTILSPSFGYLLGSLVVALYIGSIAQRRSHHITTSLNQSSSKKPSMGTMILHMIIGIFILYTIGIIYQYIILNYVADLGTATPIGTIIIGNISVFLPIDVIKAVLAGILYHRLVRLNYFNHT